MNRFQIIYYPLFFIAAMEFVLGTILLRNNPRKSRVQKAVTALSFFAAAFSFSSAMIYARASLGLSIDLVARFNWIGWFAVPAALQILFYLKDERGRAGHVVGLVLYPIWAVILGLCLFTDLIVAPGYSVVPFKNNPGPLENPARLAGSALAFWLVYSLARLKQTLRGIKKAQLEYLLTGTLIFGVGAGTTAGLMQVFGGFGFSPTLASFFSLPWVIFTYFAITQHRLFDIRFVLSRVFSTALVLLLFSVVQIALFRLLTPALGESLAILISLSVIGVVFFTTRLNSKMQRWVQRLVIQDRYDYQAVLQESIKAIITILDLDELLNYLITSIKNSMSVENVGLYLKCGDGLYVLRHGTGRYKDISPGAALDSGVVEWAGQAGRTIIREELAHSLPDEDFGPVNAALKMTGDELVLPLVYKGDVKGFIMLGPKGNRDPYLQSDVDLLESLAGHAAVAIENARLYEEARRMNESFQESEFKFRALADSSSAGIFIHQDGNLLYANRMGEAIGGYTRDEYLNMNFLGLAHPDYREMIKARARERLSGGQPPSQYEFKIIRKDGAERWVLMSAGVTSYQGKPAVIGTLIDITSRKQAEEERERFLAELKKTTLSLRESEAKFRTLAETTSAGIIIYREKRLSYVNPAAEKITGHGRDELLSMDFWQIIHCDHRELVREWGQVRLSGTDVPPEYEFMIITKQGETRWISMTAGIIEYEGKPSVIATLFDITDRKHAEEEQGRLYEERIAEQKRHVLEKEKILMDLHDGIGGITTNISILSELGQKANDVDGVRKTLSTISRLSREGISEIRSFMHSLDAKELNWRTVATELRNQGTNMVEPHSIAFTVDAAVEAVPEQPGSLLWVNLFKIYKEALTNVIKHSNARSVFVSLKISRDGLVLIVQDDGIGLSEKSNNGRGLSNMRKRAAEIGGRVAFSSGSGTRITLEIPIPLKYPDTGMAL